jgi:hypothetical protein
LPDPIVIVSIRRRKQSREASLALFRFYVIGTKDRAFADQRLTQFARRHIRARLVSNNIAKKNTSEHSFALRPLMPLS